MITSKYIYTTPFKRRGQTEMSHIKYLESLNGESTPNKSKFKRVSKTVKRVRTDIFRVISGGTIDLLSIEFEQNMQKHGALLTGRPNLSGLFSFVQRNKDKINLHSL